MKHHWIFLLLVPAMLLGCEPTDSNTAMVEFRNDLDYPLSVLQQDYDSYEPVDIRREADCRKLVFSIIARAETDEEKQVVSDELAFLLAASETFSMFDSEVLTIGSDTLRNYPPTDNFYLEALVEKVNNTMTDPHAPDAYRTQYASLAIGHLLDTIDYPGTVGTYNDQVNQAQWSEFSDWMGGNFNSLVYDNEYQCYHVAGKPIRRPVPTTSPTLDDPGR